MLSRYQVMENLVLCIIFFGFLIKLFPLTFLSCWYFASSSRILESIIIDKWAGNWLSFSICFYLFCFLEWLVILSHRTNAVSTCSSSNQSSTRATCREKFERRDDVTSAPRTSCHVLDLSAAFFGCVAFAEYSMRFSKHLKRTS